MADIKVKDLTDTTSIGLDNQVMVLTNDAQNQVQNITVGNLLTNVLSSDNGNVLEQGTDGKLYVETPENITGELSDLSTTDKSSLVAAINEVDSDIATEVTNRVNAVSSEATIRQNADNNLQSQIDAITAASDVTDIVGTYAELQAYDTTGLPDNSIIKVLQDESRQNETTYYRWVITDNVGAWVLIGEEGPYYTISQADSKFATKATVGDINNLTTTDKSSIVNAMNELASVLDPTQTADYIKNSKAIYSGEVSENALILPQIKEMAHSTFDRSKFTLVGSPNITDDGVISDITTSNYVQSANSIDFSTASTWAIETIVKINSLNSIQRFFSTRSAGNNIIVQVLQTGALIMYLSNTTTGDIANGVNLNYTASLYECIKVKLVFTGTAYEFYVNNTKTYTLNSDTKISVNVPIVIFGSVGFAPMQGSQDLKQFSITVDGVEVFSGNKTGIDTIKPDDYTVVGTPAISADGVASGFSSENYLTVPAIDFTKPFDFFFRIKPNSETTDNARIIGFNGVSDYDNAISLYGKTNDHFAILCSLKNIGSIGGGVLYFGNEYDIHFSWDGNEYKLEYKLVTDTNYTSIGTPVISSSAINTTSNTISVGYVAFVPLGDTSFDLNAFKIYIDGNLVYQPCLKIPYTESKTGSKIVQSIYRDRVTDVYEQFGYAPYYTLSDTDFTLPQGEIYGYLEKRARDIAHPVAQPFYRFSDEINEDEVRLEGAEVDKGLYLAIEQDPYLSALCTAGSTADKICLPDFRNRVIYGDVASGYVEPELPNITGNFYPYAAIAGADGAFYISAWNQRNENGAGDNNAPNVSFSASRSSSIYKNGGTVKTSGVKARWLCRWK